MGACVAILGWFAGISDWVGYAGASIIAVAYFLNQSGRLRSQDWRFPGCNLLGSLMVLTSLLVHPNLPSLVIEVFWSSISLYGVLKNLRDAAARA
jgi:hypothetical protein